MRILCRPNGQVIVPIELLDTTEIRSGAIDRCERMRQLDRLPYGTNTVAGHEVGLLGEHAVAAWLLSLGAVVRMTGDDPEAIRSGRGDLLVTWNLAESNGAAALVEVKTQRARDWKGRGPVVNARLIFLGEVDAVVWCVVGDEIWDSPVTIVGWFDVNAERHLFDPDLFDDESYIKGGIRVSPADSDLGDLVEHLRNVRHDPPPSVTPFD